MDSKLIQAKGFDCLQVDPMITLCVTSDRISICLITKTDRHFYFQVPGGVVADEWAKDVRQRIQNIKTGS
jgi:hypothetical protein